MGRADHVRKGVAVQTRLDHLIDAIDRLVDEQLASGEPVGDLGQDRCELCGGAWHGAPSPSPTEHEDLPRRRVSGAFAGDAHRRQWSRDRRPGRRRVTWPWRGGRWRAARRQAADWRSHGRHLSCPGPFATDEQREQWRCAPEPETYSGLDRQSGSGPHGDRWAIIVPIPGLPFAF